MARPLPGHAEFALKACQEVSDPLFLRKLMDGRPPGLADFGLILGKDSIDLFDGDTILLILA